MDLAFVLLPETRGPDANAVVRAYGSFSQPGDSIRVSEEPGEGERPEGMSAFTLELSTGEVAIVAHMPAPVPNREADEAARFSVSAIGTGWELPSHKAHQIVTFQSKDSTPPVTRLSRFTSVLAAVAQSSGAVGVYWGNAGATHDVEFFTSVAEEHGIVPRISLWTGVSFAREPDGRLSLLSLGMSQLDLPDLLFVAPASEGEKALGAFFDLLAFVAERGEPLPEGDTVGGSATERWPVRYVRSPVDKDVKVWRVEMK
jgi:hypothetical protein